MSTAPVTPEVPQTPALVGVRGWLLFFVIILFFNAFLYITQIAEPDMNGLADLFALGLGGLCIWSAVQLIRKKAQGVLLAKIFLFSNFGVAVLSVIGAAINAGLNGADTASITTINAVAFLVRSMIFGGIWLAYLYRSKRVANTYGV
jgi:FtsH-binding integral membrane protein